MLLTCSLTAARVSNARTMAPRPRAAPMAARPATPAPMTSTFAGGHPAGRGHLAGEEAAVEARRLDHRAIAGDVRHRRQRVHLLGAGDARDLIDRERRDACAPPAAATSASFLPGQRKQISDGAGPEQVGLVRAEIGDTRLAAGP